MPEDPNSNPASLSDLRQRIDTLDRKLVELLNERAQVVVEVGFQGLGTPP